MIAMRKNCFIILSISFCYILNQAVKNTVDIPILSDFCRNYLNDILCGIVFPAYVSVCLVLSHRKPLIKWTHILITMTLCGIFWEYVSPALLHVGTSDILDIAAYLLGGTIYYCIRRIH